MCFIGEQRYKNSATQNIKKKKSFNLKKCIDFLKICI